MKKSYLSLLFLSLFTLSIFGANVTVTMNTVSPTMTLTDKISETPVEVGTPTSKVYTFTADAGIYVLDAFNTNGVSNGTIELEVTDEETQSFSIVTITTGATNSGWVFNTDYTVEHIACSREGNVRTTVAGTSVTVNRKTFLMLVGDSYYIDLIPSETRKAEGYMTYSAMGTMTASVGNVQTAIPTGLVYQITVPQEATLFVGKKFTHYVPFKEILPDSSKVENGKKIYYYFIANNQVFNYRVSQIGKLTQAGYLKMGSTLEPLEITNEMLDSADPKRIDHDVASNSGLNVGDIFLNINECGHLKLNVNDIHRTLSIRSWQLTDNQINNYFIEPDYHYTVINENGVADNSVVTVDEKGVVTAVGTGTAVVLVTYDAIALNSSYTMGRNWGAIWPENTGVFVVSVGQENTGITSNMKINEGLNATTMKVAGDAVDAEHDVFYYPENTDGFSYTFKPIGVQSVTIAHPVIGSQMATYNGFSSEGVTANEDGSYTVLLKLGRNIVKMTSANGASEYQVMTAKTTGYEIVKTENPESPILPGDEISVKFHGLFHPANKMAGIYNMSAYIQFNGVPNGTSLILSPNQYTFGSSESAQTLKLTVPSDWDASQDLKLENGVIQVNGYGDPIGNHRNISLDFGRSPNFTAIAHKTYFGALPDVTIDVASPTDGITFTGIPDGAEVIVTTAIGDTLQANSSNQYLGTYAEYTYEIYASGYKGVTGTFSIEMNQGIVPVSITMTPITDTKWDGTGVAKPEKVTVEESQVIGSEFENKAGYYKITNSYELAWFANEVTIKQQGANNAILVNDIELNDKSWTPIGAYTTAYNYTGTFEGNHKIIKGLLIDGTKGSSYKAFFSYVNGGTVRNLTTEGVITNGVASMFGGLAGSFLIENCHNKANVNSTTQSTGGFVGSVMSSSTAQSVIRNCSNSGDVVLSGGNYQYTGGFAGGVAGAVTIENCWNTGTVTSPYRYVGGFTAKLSGTAVIQNCYNTGNISAKGIKVGGIAGNASAGTIKNCFNTGSITNTDATGYGATKGVGTAATVTNCYAPNTIGSSLVADGTILTTAASFASGKVTWLLGDAFGQTIGTETIPVLGGTTVYKVTYSNNLNAEKDSLYTNGNLPVINKTGYTSSWFTENEGSVITSVSADSDIYLLYAADPSTGLNITNTQLYIYPNPFTNYINIKTDKSQTIKIFNTSGQCVINKKVSLGESTIDVQSLQKGVYVLQSDNKTMTLIKQ